MAHWFKMIDNLRRLAVTLSVTVCVTSGLVFGQYSNNYQNNVNPQLNWRTPTVQGQPLPQPQLHHYRCRHSRQIRRMSCWFSTLRQPNRRFCFRRSI